MGRSPLEQNESLIFQLSHYRTKIKMEVKIMLSTQMPWWESSFSYSLIPGVSNTGRKGLGKQLRRKSREEIRQNLASQERLLNCFRRDGGRRNGITQNDLGITNLTVP